MKVKKIIIKKNGWTNLMKIPVDSKEIVKMIYQKEIEAEEVIIEEGLKDVEEALKYVGANVKKEKPSPFDDCFFK